jgi:hypothetical protein
MVRSEETAMSLTDDCSMEINVAAAQPSPSRNTAVVCTPWSCESPQDIAQGCSPRPSCSQSMWEFFSALAGVECLWWTGHILSSRQQSGVSVGKALPNIEKIKTKTASPLATLRILSMLRPKLIAGCILPRCCLPIYPLDCLTNCLGFSSNLSLWLGMQK